MDIDEDKIDQAVLALLSLTLLGKAKSVVLTEQGLRESERLFNEKFGKPGT